MIKLDIKDKRFKDNIIFENTMIEIKEKDFIGIKGISGSGKTTLLSMISLLDTFNGEYYIEEQKLDYKNLEAIRMKYFSYVFQNPYLIPYLSVYDNIVLPLKNSKIKYDKNEIIEISKSLNIDGLLNRYPEKLSGGEAQRVNIARAYFSKRKVMVVDEPTGSLDPENALNVLELLKYLNKEKNITIIMVTHSNEFDNYFNKIYYLKNKGIELC